jgi:hypothetical protein
MAVLCVVTLLSAVVEAFLVLYEVLPGVSVGALLAVVGNLLLTRAGRRTVDAGWGGFVLGALWVVIVVGLAAQRTEGDLVVPGTAGGLVFMLVGTLAAVVGIASRQSPPPASPNGLSPERSSSA